MVGLALLRSWEHNMKGRVVFKSHQQFSYKSLQRVLQVSKMHWPWVMGQGLWDKGPGVGFMGGKGYAAVVTIHYLVHR